MDRQTLVERDFGAAREPFFAAGQRLLQLVPQPLQIFIERLFVFLGLSDRPQPL